MNVIKYLNIPYAYCGRDFSGCDCFGIVRLWYQEECKVILPDYQSPGKSHKDVPNSYIIEHMHILFKQVAWSDINTNDIILIQNKSDSINHVGVMVSHTDFLHILEGCTPHVARVSLWKDKIHSFYRYRDWA